jgi:hypothetical protein
LDTEQWMSGRVHAINFSTEHKSLLSHTVYLVESGQVAMHQQFDKLITSLRTAVANEFALDKEATTFDDLFDAFRLSLRYFSLE